MEPGNTHQLIIQEEKGERTFSLPEGEIHLGRASSNELQLREKSVSRVHCRIERDGDRVVVFDAGTSNAARLRRHGKERIKGANGRILRDQDVLFLGRLEIVYRGCSGPGARTTSASQQSEIPTVRGAVPVEKPQAPIADPNLPQQPAAQMPQPQGQPYPAPQDPNQPYPAQQDPNQPYPAPQDPNQPYPAQPYPGQPYPAQQGYPQQQPGAYPPQYIPPAQQQPPQNYNPGAPGAVQQPVVFNPAPVEPEKPKKKIKKRIKPKKSIAKSSKVSKAVVPKKTSGSPAVPLAIGAVTLVVLLVVVSGVFKSMRDDNDLQRVAIEAQQANTSRRQMSEREKALQGQLGETNSKIEKLQQMLAALEKSRRVPPGRKAIAGGQDTDPSDPSEELTTAPRSEEQILPSSGGDSQEIAETRAMIASLIKKRNQIQGGLTGGTDMSKIEASIARRTAVMNNSGNRILSVEDDEDTRKTAVAKIPQTVELSKKDYADLIERLKETVGNYGLPTTVHSPKDLDPDLTTLLRATGDDGAKGLVTVYLYSSELRAKMEKTTSFLKRRIDALMANAYKINKDKGKYKAGGGGYYGNRHNHYLEQLQRVLELSEKKIEIKKGQDKRLAAFQRALGAGFDQLTTVEATKHLTSVYSRSKDDDMKRKMVGSFSKGNALQAVPALIKSLSSRDQELKGLVKSALATITGVNLGDNKKIWEAWWKENN